MTSDTVEHKGSYLVTRKKEVCEDKTFCIKTWIFDVFILRKQNFNAPLTQNQKEGFKACFNSRGIPINLNQHVDLYQRTAIALLCRTVFKNDQEALHKAQNRTMLDIPHRSIPNYKRLYSRGSRKHKNLLHVFKQPPTQTEYFSLEDLGK